MTRKGILRRFLSNPHSTTARKSRRARSLRSRGLSLESLEKRELLTITASISATDDQAVEGTTDTGEFTISVDLPTGYGAEVAYEVSFNELGDGCDDIAYDSSPDLTGTAHIGGGSNTAVYTITAEQDGDDVNEELIATLTGGTWSNADCTESGSLVISSSASSATITLEDDDAASDPEVTVSTDDRFATEPDEAAGTAADTAEFVVSRGDDTSGDTNVNFSLSGTAVYGDDPEEDPPEDYTFSVVETGATVSVLSSSSGTTGVVKIPDTLSSVTIVATPVGDTYAEKVETVVLEITSGTGYTVGSPASEAVAIMDPNVEYIPSNDQLTIAGDSCGDDGDGNHNICFCVSGLGCFGYKSDANPHPTVAVDALIQPSYSSTSLSTVEATLDFGGIEETVYYNAGSISAADLYRLAVQVDASSLSTGRYDWTMTVTQIYEDGEDSFERVDTYTGSKNIINATESVFGRRWGAGEYQRLMSDDDGVLWMNEGNLLLFESDGSGGYKPISNPLGYWTLTESSSTGFSLTDADGTVDAFNGSGFRTSSTDRNGNLTTYSYTNGNLTGITLPNTRHTTIGYDTNGHIDYVLDYAGRRTEFTVDSSGQLQSITLPDTDGTGGEDAPVYEFDYAPSTGLLESVEDPEGLVTAYVHDSAGLLRSIEHADGTSDEYVDGLVSVFSGGLQYVGASSESGTSSDPADLSDYRVSDLPATRTNSANPDDHTEITVDNFGQPTSIVDVYGNETTIVRDDAGRIVRLVEPDPDGNGSQEANDTTYTYDSRGNMLTATYADGSVETWTYHATYNVATSYTFTPPSTSLEDTIQTVYTIDSSTGNVTRERQIHNLDDSVYTSDASVNPDIVIDYTYTDGTETNSPPKGLLETITYTSHPDSPVTTYEYNSYGELVTETLPDPDGTGSLYSPVYEYTWNSDGTMATMTETDAGASFSYTTNYYYDDAGQLTEERSPDPDGTGDLPRPVVKYTYNADGTVATMTETTDATGAAELVTAYTYTNGMLTQVTYPDPDGTTGSLYSPVTQYTYTDGLLTAVTETSSDPSGESQETLYVYDEMNRLRKTVYPDPDGTGSLPSVVERYYYDDAGRMDATREETTDSSDPDVDTDYTYDVLGRLTSVILPDADTLGGTNRATTTYTYYAGGEVKTVTDAMGAVTTYEYNDLGQLVMVTYPDPDGTGDLNAPTTEYAYDAGGRLVTETQSHTATGAEELVTTYAYDALDRLTSVTLPDPDGSGTEYTSPVTTYQYSNAGDLLYVTDAEGTVTRYAYDYLHRVTREVLDNDSIQAKTRYSYDDFGNLESVQDAELRETSYDYDYLHRMTSETVDEGGLALTWTYSYDAFGNLVQETDPESQDTSYDYDGLNRLVETTLEDGSDTVYTYNSRGDLASVTDPTDNTTSYAYDYLHRLASETITVNSVARTESYLYDLAGNLIWKEDRLDQITRYDYDDLGRVYQERWKDSSGTTIRTISYDFDDLGRLVEVSDPDSATYEYTYDDLGRVTQTVHDIVGLTPDVTLSQTFDDDSNRTQLAATIGTTDDFVTDYTYDALDRVTYIVQQDQTGGNAVSDKLVRFAYNDAGDFTYVWRYASTSTASNYVGRTKYIAYDDAGRVTDFKHDGSGLSAIDFNVRYDDTLLDYVTYGGTTTDYSYDSVDQLTGIDYTGTGTPPDQTYSYDDSGNRTNTGYSTGEYNQLEDDGTYTYSYDHNGNRQRRFDSSGNQVKYFWDHRNRLTRVDVRNSSGVTLERYTFEYDAYNRLVTKTVDSDANGTVNATYHWVYDGDQAVLQFDGNAAADLSHRYLWGPVVDQLLADETVDDGGTEDVLWALTDWQGSVRHLASYDESTSVTSIENHKFYDAFGNVASETNSAVDTIFGYTGRMWDDDLDLQNNLNRWYDSEVGRWVTEDPADFLAGDPNLYRYVGNSPNLLLDPTGESAVGHHFFPLAVLREFFKSGKITPAAARLAEAYYSGATSPSHCYGRYGGIKHSQYNKEVTKEFSSFLETLGKSSKGKVNAAEMHEFIDKRLLGENASTKIKKFNRAIKKSVVKSADYVDPQSLTKRELIARGKQFRSNRSVFVSARLAGILAIVSGLALEQVQGFADTCATTPYVRNAYAAAMDGDVSETEVQLLGSARSSSRYGLYDELIARGFDKAAANFELGLRDVFNDITYEINEPVSTIDE